MLNTSLPEQLNMALRQALQGMLSNEQHELLPFYRRAIYNELDGVLVGPKNRMGTDPFRRRARLLLDISTVKKVLPIWQTEKPNDQWPQDLTALAEAVSKGILQPDDARVAVDHAELELLSYVEQVRLRDQSRFVGASSGAMWVCFAALTLGFEAHGRFTFDMVMIEKQDTDADIDSTTSDVASLAACAYAGAAWDLTANNRVRRKEFWAWWLKEAVPRAWQASRQG